DGKPVADSADLLGTVAGMRPGHRADLLVWRAGQASHLQVTVGAFDSGVASNGDAQALARFGLALRPTNEQERRQLGVSQGLVIEQVSGRAARAGLQAGDVVLSVNGAPVANAGALRGELDRARGAIALLVQRDGARLYVPVDPG
ncbi:PDZ domain-containing protein, partial [Burkholderia ubonensis]|uniref:PDZ domain-containing protein n=1 Tax=Burkholderia ubonensis TaxID=101571 RepID=UPI000A835A10